jgi:hypothetical protein
VSEKAAHEPPSDLDLAREEYDLACYWEAMFSSDLEGAYMNRDGERKQRLTRQMHTTARLKRQAYDRWQRLQRASAPSFEALLSDPTMQFDKDGEVAQSILDYQRTHPNRVCMERITPVVTTLCAPAAVPSSAVFLCLKARPCPVHETSAKPDPGAAS